MQWRLVQRAWPWPLHLTAFQDLSLAPSDHCAATAFADDQPSAGVSQDLREDENACDPASPALPSASGGEGCGALDGSSEHTPAADAGQRDDDAAHNVLSPAAPMSLFSPTADAASIVSPSAAASYAEAAEALAHDNSIASVFASPVAPFAHGGGLQQGDGHAAARQEEPLGNVPGESDGSAR